MYGIMEFHRDWNNEVIAQFYATLFVEEGNVRQMHWMIEGRGYSVNYDHFATLLGFTS